MRYLSKMTGYLLLESGVERSVMTSVDIKICLIV